MRKHWAALAATTALLIGVPASPALAHEGNPDYRSVIDRVTPQVPGVSFEVLSYDSYFQLLDQHGHEVVIYGYENEPYARVLKDGTVQVNERSPALYLNDTRFPTSQVPPIANPKAPPKWKTVDDSGTFLWHDHRMHYGSTATKATVAKMGSARSATRSRQRRRGDDATCAAGARRLLPCPARPCERLRPCPAPRHQPAVRDDREGPAQRGHLQIQPAGWRHRGRGSRLQRPGQSGRQPRRLSPRRPSILDGGGAQAQPP